MMGARDRAGGVRQVRGPVPTPTTSQSRGRWHGFTLVEALIAVAALAVIAVGISQVFRATGETVKGGKRLANLNTSAAILERQLREDFARITRDGFLVIRNEEAFDQSGNDPEVYPGDNRRRPRRVDEIVFFATGDFVTQRPPVNARLIARAPAARIYIGHGHRHDASDPDYGAEIDLENNGISGIVPETFGLPGPNQYAKDWILMRHVTLLTGPVNTQPNVAANQRDTLFQIGGQPAARSIFREWAQRATVPTTGLRPNVRPLFGSGAVDIATTDLTEIRRFLLATPSPSIGLPSGAPVPPSAPLPSTYPAGPAAIGIVHEWMKQALPADSDAGHDNGQGGRMRVEPAPPNVMGVNWRTMPPEELERARADQLMLASSNFVPGCTDFIVEWSFGDVYPNADPRSGQLKWHGMDRWVDFNNNGNDDPAEYVARPYGVGGVRDQHYVAPGGNVASAPIPAALIHEPTSVSLYSYFGYLRPDNPVSGVALPWPWPRLIRITVTLADPQEPWFEQTYQFIFKLPADSGDRRF